MLKYFLCFVCAVTLFWMLFIAMANCDYASVAAFHFGRSVQRPFNYSSSSSLASSSDLAEIAIPPPLYRSFVLRLICVKSNVIRGDHMLSNLLLLVHNIVKSNVKNQLRQDLSKASNSSCRSCCH